MEILQLQSLWLFLIFLILLFAFILNPILDGLGGLFQGIARGLREERRKAAGLPEPEKKCPQCGEMVKQEALKCRFCGEFFDANDRPA